MGKQTENIVISPEYLEKIRRFAAIRPENEFIYVPVAYRSFPDELKPKFSLRSITGDDALHFADEMRGEVYIDGGRAQVQIKHGAYTIAVLKKGIIGWENYYDSNGKIMEFSEHNKSNLPMELMEELSEIITSSSRLTDEEKLGLK